MNSNVCLFETHSSQVIHFDVFCLIQFYIEIYFVNENDVLFKGMRLWKSVNETEMSMKQNLNETERFLALRSMGMTLVFQVL